MWEDGGREAPSYPIQEKKPLVRDAVLLGRLDQRLAPLVGVVAQVRNLDRKVPSARFWSQPVVKTPLLFLPLLVSPLRTKSSPGPANARVTVAPGTSSSLDSATPSPSESQRTATKTRSE